MKNRSQRVSIFAVIVTFVTTVLAGLLVNIVSTSASLSVSNRFTQIASVAGVTVGLLAVFLAAAVARQTKRAAEENKEALSNAQRQADSLDSAADDSGVNSALLYETVLRDSRIPPDVRFIYSWTRLERVMRRQVKRMKGDDLTGLPLGKLISEFVDLQGFPDGDKDELRGLLRLRNTLMHGVDDDPNPEDVEKAIAKVESFVERAGGDFVGG